MSSHGFTQGIQPFLRKISLHTYLSPSDGQALELIFRFIGRLQPYIEYVAIKHRVLIFLGLLNMLVTVSHLLFPVFASLILIRFSSASNSLVATAVLAMMAGAQ